MQKVVSLFGQLNEAYLQEPFLTKLPVQVLLQPAKISKGESYKGLPYVMLDYPRCFGKQDVFAVRTFFWWGNFLSITLHLKGIYKQQYQNKIIEASQKSKLNKMWINSNSLEWEHHLNNSYKTINGLLNKESVQENSVLKLVSTIELNEWEGAEDFLQTQFKKYLEILFA